MQRKIHDDNVKMQVVALDVSQLFMQKIIANKVKGNCYVIYYLTVLWHRT